MRFLRQSSWVSCLLCALVAPLSMAAEEAGDTPSVQPAVPVPAVPKLAKGLLMQYGERLIFTPCRDRSYHDLKDISSQGVLRQELNVLGLAPTQALYVEFLATLEGPNLMASGLNMARRDTRCYDAGIPNETWRALGQDGSWSFVLAQGMLRFERQGKPLQEFPETRVSARDEGFDLQSPAFSGETWAIEPGYCRTPQQDVVFGWRVNLNLAGEKLSGCAWLR